MTNGAYVERVSQALVLAGVKPDRAAIWSRLDDALGSLAEYAWKRGLPLLQKDFTLAFISGTAKLVTLTDAVMTSILVGSIKYLRGATDTPEWQKAKNRARLADEKSPLGRVWYAVENNEIFAKLDDGLTDASDQNVTFNAYYAPLISTVPAELEDVLIDIGAGYAAAAS